VDIYARFFVMILCFSRNGARSVEIGDEVLRRDGLQAMIFPPPVLPVNDFNMV